QPAQTSTRPGGRWRTVWRSDPPRAADVPPAGFRKIVTTGKLEDRGSIPTFEPMDRPLGRASWNSYFPDASRLRLPLLLRPPRRVDVSRDVDFLDFSGRTGVHLRRLPARGLAAGKAPPGNAFPGALGRRHLGRHGRVQRGRPD